MADDAVLDRFSPNRSLMKAISEARKNWSIDLDEELAELLKDVVNTDHPGSIRNLIKSINVSTQRVSEISFRWALELNDCNKRFLQTSEDTDYLVSLDRRTYWESDSYAATYNGYNSIRLFLKPDVKIK